VTRNGTSALNAKKLQRMDYLRMLYISYGSVCELETQILLAGDLDLIEKRELVTVKKISKKSKEC